MAAALSIAQSTLKTHTLRLFDKTGRHRKSELVRLAAHVRRLEARVRAEEAHELTEIIAQAIRARYETGATEKA